MDFEAQHEHELLRESVRDFFDRELPEAKIREYDRARRIPRSIWKQFAQQGWMGISVPEEYGGAGSDIMAGSIFCEELARRFPSLATDWLLTSMTARLFLEVASDEHKREYLPKLVQGDFLMGFGMSEPGGGTDVLALKTRAQSDADGWTVRGQKLYTSLADDADAILVLCRTETPDESKRARGLSLVLTPRNQPAVTVRRLELMGMRAACTCEVFFDDARAPLDAVVGERGRGWYHLLATLDEERILCRPCMWGLPARRSTRRCSTHATGWPLGARSADSRPCSIRLPTLPPNSSRSGSSPPKPPGCSPTASPAPPRRPWPSSPPPRQPFAQPIAACGCWAATDWWKKPRWNACSETPGSALSARSPSRWCAIS